MNLNSLSTVDYVLYMCCKKMYSDSVTEKRLTMAVDTITNSMTSQDNKKLEQEIIVQNHNNSNFM